MRISLTKSQLRTQGFALALTLVFGSLTLLVLASALGWSASNLRLNFRNNQYFRTVSAAEAATEGVISRLETDYLAGGEALVQTHLDLYRQAVPSPSENDLWANYRFSDHQGQTGRNLVQPVGVTEFRALSAQYKGLNGYAASFRIVSDASEANTQFNVVAGVQQDVETATIPLFQFAIFYNMDLEINPGPQMTVNGPVHCNATIYCQPQDTLTFQSDVTAAGSLVSGKKPGDPVVRTPGTIVYQAEHDAGVSSLTVPVGTNNNPAVVRQVVEVPPANEPFNSDMGKQRYYNKADLIIKVTDSGVVATSGVANNFGTTIPSDQVAQFVNPNVTFFNKRENQTIQATQVDVAKLRQWDQTNSVLRSSLSFGTIRTLYVADQRTQTGSTESGVRLINGETLLPQGLTVATPNPLYVKGNYNAPAADRGTTNTAQTLPASLVADAITLLSPNWTDANSTAGLSARIASDTTVNAAFLAGIVPTVEGSYSGGVENFPRFLEDWSGSTFTYNGSMVVMFESIYATGQWRGTGSTVGIYNPPNRNWAFDTNFRDPSKIPPGTPSACVLIRQNWVTLAPSSPVL